MERQRCGIGRKGGRAAAAAALFWSLVVAAIAPAGTASAATLQAPGKGEVRALAIGVDLYRNVRPLFGAVADAEDLAISLRSVGVTDVTLMTNGAADRASVMTAFDQLVARTRPGDLVVLSIAGHGASEPERVPGTKPSGRDEVYILAGFDTHLPGSRERIFGDEFKAVIRRIEDKAADILFIADTCYAGGMTRSVDERSSDMSFRQLPAYSVVEDDLAPISTTKDAVASLSDFKNLTFLAAVDAKTTSPEVRIPGIPGKRGALSYATARAFQGAADSDGDGGVSRRELYQYVRQSVYQLSDQRQNIFTEDPVGTDLDRSSIFRFDGAATPVAAPAPAQEEVPPIRLAALDDESAQAITRINPAAVPFQVVAPDQADLVYDARRREAVSGGDVIASGVASEDIPFVVDRMGALAVFKRLSERSPQTVRITPDDRRYHQGDELTAQVPELNGRHLVLFDIAGDGTVMFLYPRSRAEEKGLDKGLDLKLSVSPPFGADLLVAVSAPQPMPDLVAFLKANAQQRKPARVADYLATQMPADARLGFTVLYTVSGEQ